MKLRSILAIGATAAGITAPIAALAPVASADGCHDWTFAVGGVNDGGASFFPDWAVDTKVGYSGGFNAMREGIDNLTWAVDDFKNNCPGSQVILAGHSQGAAIVHAYITENPWRAGDIKSAVLYADPKQDPTGESGSWEGQFLGYPLAGTDSYFNGVPVLQFCSGNDVICNRGAGWFGYLFQQAHTQPYWPYLDVRAYAGDYGIWWV